MKLHYNAVVNDWSTTCEFLDKNGEKTSCYTSIDEKELATRKDDMWHEVPLIDELVPLPAGGDVNIKYRFVVSFISLIY